MIVVVVTAVAVRVTPTLRVAVERATVAVRAFTRIVEIRVRVTGGSQAEHQDS